MTLQTPHCDFGHFQAGVWSPPHRHLVFAFILGLKANLAPKKLFFYLFLSTFKNVYRTPYLPPKTTGQEKEGCTVLLGGMYKKSTGQSYKLPPFFIFKLETSGAKVQPVIERKAEALGAYATTTDSGWMKDEKFLW